MLQCCTAHLALTFFLLLVPCYTRNDVDVNWDVNVIWPRAGEGVRAVDAAASEIDALILISRGSPHQSATLIVILDNEFELLNADIVGSARSDRSTLRTTLAHPALTAAGPHELSLLLLSADGADLASANRTFNILKVDLAPHPARLVVGANVNHDANFALTLDGAVACVVELERLFEVRYYILPNDDLGFFGAASMAFHTLFSCSGISNTRVLAEQGVMVEYSEPKRSMALQLLRMLVPAVRWRTTGHHWAHATLGLYDSPFDRPLIISVDGGGNDGVFNIYSADRRQLPTMAIKEVRRLAVNLGETYAQLAYYCREVAVRPCCSWLQSLGLAGKLMGFEALGRVQATWLNGVRKLFELSAQRDDQVAALLPIGALTHELLTNMNTSVAADWAATVQAAFTALVVDTIRDELRAAHDYDGVVLVGGCALNIKLNSAVRMLLRVHVPAAPNDAGLGVGAAWTVRPPAASNVRTPAFCGPALFDAADLERAALAMRASAASFDMVVRILSAGHALGVVRGRTEWGPRALGHRSLLMYPADPRTQEQLNAIKQRQPWRPIAPVLTVEALGRLVDGSTADANFAYMSFAMPLSAAARAELPGIAHADGSARVRRPFASPLLRK